MYLIAVLGLELGWLVIGAWIALTADECLRSVLMYLRWNSRKWEHKVLIQ